MAKDGIRGTSITMLKHLAMIQTIAKATDATISALHELAVQFRAAQLFAHEAHNLTSGPSFHEDHEFFGGTYGRYEGYYDAMVERMIGLNGSAAADVRGIQAAAVQMADSKPSADSAEAAYRTLLDWNKSIGEMIDKLSKEQTMDEGVRDLIVGIANELQVQSYKIQQRLGGEVAKSGTSEGARKGAETKRAGVVGVDHGKGISEAMSRAWDQEKLKYPGLSPDDAQQAIAYRVVGDYAQTNGLQLEDVKSALQSIIGKSGTSEGVKRSWDTRRAGGGKAELAAIEREGLKQQGRAEFYEANPVADASVNPIPGLVPLHPNIETTKHPTSYPKGEHDLITGALERERLKGADQKFTAKEKKGMDYYAKFKAGKMHVDSTPDEVRAQLREDDSGRSKPLTDAQVEYLTQAIKREHGEHIDLMRQFNLHKGLTALQSFQANIGKAGKGWYHGNQHESGTTSVKAEKWVSKMRESRECAKSGSALNSKAAEVEAMAIWKKMAIGERQHAMEMLSDNASEDIGKARDNGFEFGHGRSRK